MSLEKLEDAAAIDDFADVSAADMVACVRRELAMRGSFYPRQVAAGRMTQAKADRELRHLGAVLQLALLNQQADAAIADEAEWPVVWRLPEDCADVAAAEIDRHALRAAVVTWREMGGDGPTRASVAAGLLQAFWRFAFPGRRQDLPLDDAVADFAKGSRDVVRMLARVEAGGWDAADADRTYQS